MHLLFNLVCVCAEVCAKNSIMSPWIPGFVGRDQLFSRWDHAKSTRNLPWQSFPVNDLCMMITVVVTINSIALHMHFVENTEGLRESYGDVLYSLGCILFTALGTALLSIVPCTLIFVLLVYTHAIECSPLKDSGDCTRFVKFKDPVTQVERIVHICGCVNFNPLIQLIIIIAIGAGEVQGKAHRHGDPVRDVL